MIPRTYLVFRRDGLWLVSRSDRQTDIAGFRRKSSALRLGEHLARRDRPSSLRVLIDDGRLERQLRFD